MNPKRYWGMSRGELTVTSILMGLISLLAIFQTLQSREAPYQQFISRAQRIAAALEAFARDHGGCYPDDGRDNQSPPGLSPRYIQWQEEWNIDYEVHDNGQGGRFVALEYLGRYKKNREYHALGLTLDPEIRRRYGRGQPIPGKLTRIWVFYEQAPIYKPEGCIKNRAKMN